MYTQCTHCKAVFQVDMKDVTTAQGELRCGECLNTFNAVKHLSTSKPEKPLFSNNADNEEEDKNIATMDDWQSHSTPLKAKTKNNITDKQGTIFIASLFLLTFLLVAQILYRNPSIFSEAPPQREPENIQMLNYNVFAHPSESGVLVISGVIQNHAKHAQPFPTLLISLTDNQSKIIGLSRFTPNEYLPRTTQSSLMPMGIPVSLNLKIKDPGSNATHFKFDFQ
ncbi:MAG: zinc-ribbon and DUF3426 domain-containing protein [Cocleimonas sp.]